MTSRPGGGRSVSCFAIRAVARSGFAPAHLSVRKAGGDIVLDWVRTSRVGGEDFQAVEIPQAEMDERYRVSVRKDGLVLRVADVFGPGFVYTSAMQTEDAAAGTLEFGVARLSATVGFGPERVIKANA